MEVVVVTEEAQEVSLPFVSLDQQVLDMTELDWRLETILSTEDDLAARVAAIVTEPFDLGAGTPVRARLLTVSRERELSKQGGN